VNTLKALVFSAFLAIFAVFPVVAQDNTPTPEQVEKVLTQICGDTITKEYLEAFLEGKDKDSRAALSGYDLASDILGDDLITPYEVASTRSLLYSDAQFASFKDTLPSREVLEWLKANDYMLVAGPPVELSLLDVRRRNDALFYSKNGEGWYAASDEEFSRTDTVGSVWLALRKSPVLDSTNKTWDEQQALLSENERVPNAAEVAWGLTTYKEVRGAYLMDSIWVRTFSVDSGGRHVYVFGFGQSGLFVGRWWDDGRLEHLGVFSARKF